jgi:hypothetical protein
VETRTIHLRIGIYGKAPSKYGPNRYKVALAVRPLLVLAGLEHVGSGKWYEYVRPPGGKAGRQVVIKVEVPTDAEIQRIAKAMHTDGKAQFQQILGFFVRYQPAGRIVYQLMEPVVTESGYRGEIRALAEPVRQQAAEFEFGVSSPWSIRLIWDRGDGDDSTWCRHESETVTD